MGAGGQLQSGRQGILVLARALPVEPEFALPIGKGASDVDSVVGLSRSPLDHGRNLGTGEIGGIALKVIILLVIFVVDGAADDTCASVHVVGFVEEVGRRNYGRTWGVDFFLDRQRHSRRPRETARGQMVGIHSSRVQGRGLE